MICISPSAPRGDTACALPALSTRMTARIHCSGIANRRDASVTNDAYGPTGRGFDGSEVNAAVASSALAPDGSSDADKEARKHAAIRISRRLAIVPAAVRGDALLAELPANHRRRARRLSQNRP